MNKNLQLFFLTFFFAFIQCTRDIFTYLYDYRIGKSDFTSMQDDLNVGSEQYELLNGSLYFLLTMLVLLLVGGLGDQYDRREIIVGGLVLNFLGLIAFALADSYYYLYLYRFLTSCGYGFYIPTAFSLVNDIFSSDESALRHGILASGLLLGLSGASISLVIEEYYGWRKTIWFLLCFGVMVFPLFIWFFQLPNRKILDKQYHMELSDIEKKNRFIYITKMIFKSNLLLLLFIGASFRFVCGYIDIYFMPEFFEKAYETKIIEYCIINSFILIFGAAIATYIGGHYCDKWILEGKIDAAYNIAIRGAIIAAIWSVVLFVVDNFYSSLFFYFLFLSSAGVWFGPIISEVIDRAPQYAIARIMSYFMIFTELNGLIFRTLTSWIIDEVTNYESDDKISLINYCLLGVILFSLLSSSYFFYKARESDERYEDTDEFIGSLLSFEENTYNFNVLADYRRNKNNK